MPVIGKSLGHKSMASTQRYAHLELGPVRASMEKAVGLMKQAAAMPGQKQIVNLKNKRA